MAKASFIGPLVKVLPKLPEGSRPGRTVRTKVSHDDLLKLIVRLKVWQSVWVTDDVSLKSKNTYGNLVRDWNRGSYKMAEGRRLSLLTRTEGPNKAVLIMRIV